MIKKIYLSNFRNFESKLIEFDDKMTIVVGDNGVGKTNILEAIRLLSTGKSFKTYKNEEMINYDEELSRVKGLIVRENKEYKPELVITRGRIGTRSVKIVPKKRLMINGVPKRTTDFSGYLLTVLFTPEDMNLVTSSPQTRRRFLDMVLSQTDREYYRSILSYEKGLRQRNKLLFAIREMGADRSQLVFWDKLLIRNGDYISNTREGFIDFVNGKKSFSDHNFEIFYDRSAISEARLDQYKKEEVAAATTLVGPHRDDFSLKVEDNSAKRDLDKYGSRGEQRMGVLWLKLSEIDYIKEKKGEKPTLLLDDIFSELDHEHRDAVSVVIKDYQTILTTADPHFIEKYEGLIVKVEDSD